MNAFKYNKDAKYSTSGYNPKTISTSSLEVAVSEKDSFQVKVSNPLNKYLNPPVKSDGVVNTWFKNPGQFYQNQLNFAVYCATTGCGVSYANHLNHPNLLTRSVYSFHFYYQLRRVLSEIQAPEPSDKNFKPFSNRINKKAYERICNEFGIDVKTDFRQNLDRNHGLGTLYYKYSHRPYNYDYWAGHTSFQSKVGQVHLGSIEQHHSNAWTTFILDSSNGFTRAGVERLNESIRAYVWCLLGSQAQVRSDVLNDSTGFEVQKQYLANLEDAINSAVDLPSSIERYQDVLRYARSKVDFVVGTGLYMLPSILRLQIGTIKNYNNKILIAGDDQSMGKNNQLNDDPSEMHVRSVSHKIHANPVNPVSSVSPVSPVSPVSSVGDHEAEKGALVVGLTFVGLIILYFTKKQSSNTNK